MRLVGSSAEQHVLERVLEETKPPMPVTDRPFHYLLLTPFRYFPQRSGSRFRRYGQREGVFYAAEEIATAVCERAFLQFLFRADAPQALAPRNPIEHTVFAVSCKTEHAIDLTAAPFNADADTWEALVEYAPCQAFADVVREAGAQIIRYTSVRDLVRRCNIALLDPVAFGVTQPTTQQTWRFLLKDDQLVVAMCEYPRSELEFPLSMFSADPRLAPLQ
jgi:hypothetical protein